MVLIYIRTACVETHLDTSLEIIIKLAFWTPEKLQVLDRTLPLLHPKKRRKVLLYKAEDSWWHKIHILKT